jgi:hypothetical protein
MAHLKIAGQDCLVRAHRYLVLLIRYCRDEEEELNEAGETPQGIGGGYGDGVLCRRGRGFTHNPME